LSFYPLVVTRPEALPLPLRVDKIVCKSGGGACGAIPASIGEPPTGAAPGAGDGCSTGEVAAPAGGAGCSGANTPAIAYSRD